VKTHKLRKYRFHLIAPFGLVAATIMASIACSAPAETIEVIKEVPVERVITIEKPVEVIREVIVEKIVDRPVEKIVIREVEKPVEVIREVPVERVVLKPVEIIREVIKEVPVITEVVKTVPGETQKEVITKILIATPSPALFSADGSQRIPPSGYFILSDNNVLPGISVPSRAGSGFEMSYYAWGVMEMPLFQNADGIVDANVSLWTSWTIAPDQSKVSWTLREGVQFHGGWGEMTAEDVVFSHNNANHSEDTRFYGYGDNAWMGEMRVTGKYSGEMDFKEFNPRWAIRLSNVQDHQPWIIPKRMVDELGEDKAIDHMIGTGPYEVKKWVAHDRVDLEAMSSHWRVVPKNERFSVIEIGEPLAMQAAFLTGEVDIVGLPNSLIKNTLARTPGATFKPIGRPDTQMIHYTGNFWLKGTLHDRTEGTVEFPRPAYKEALDNPGKFPHVGNIDDPEDMQRALKVRIAMTKAIDRESIVRNVFDGFGTTTGTQFGFRPIDASWKAEWDPPAYDPVAAAAELRAAGIPEGFEFPVFFPSTARTISDEAAFAAAAMWREVGLNPVIDNGTYASGRDRRFDGRDNIIRMHHIYTGDLDGQRGEGMGLVQTWYSTELPRSLLDILNKNNTEPDQAKRINNNQIGQDYLSKWRLFLPLAVISQHYMYRPEIVRHSQHFTMSSQFMAPWTVEVSR